MKKARSFYRGVLSGGVALALTACAQSPTAQAPDRPPLRPFTYHEVLERSYTALADKASSEMDWVDAYRFQNKAAQARQGRALEPDDPRSRSVAVAKDPEIAAAYKTLRGYIDEGGAFKASADLALAQAAYDCWIEDAEESADALTMGTCRLQYESAVRRVGDFYAPQGAPPPGQPSAASSPFASEPPALLYGGGG